MVKDEKDKVRETQLPGRNFSSGNLTLFQIAESHGQKLGTPQSMPADAVVSDRDKEILEKAIPADRFRGLGKPTAKAEDLFPYKGYVKQLNNKSLQAGYNQAMKKVVISRGLVMTHEPTGNKVTVVEPDVDTTTSGEIRHRVCVVGTKKKYLVPESSLVLNGKSK